MIHKQNKSLLLLSGLIVMLLTGCAVSPQNFGISYAEWKGYDKTKQKEILMNYEQLKQEFSKQDQDVQKMVAQKMLDSDVMTLEVKVFGGEAMLPPFTGWQGYMPVAFTIMENSCINALLGQEGVEEKTILRACYKDRQLRLDPSRYDPAKKEGTFTIPYSPLWDQGFTYYGVNSDGHVKLRNVTIVVKQNQ